MDILHLIDRLEEIVAEARRLPIGGGTVVSRQVLLDLVDQMRVAVPREVYDARDVLDNRDEVLREAQQRAEDVLNSARDELERRMDQTEVVAQAKERAKELIAEGERRANELLQSAEGQARERLDEAQAVGRKERQEADAYALQTLRKLEEQLEGFIATVHNGVDALEARSAERPRG